MQTKATFQIEGMSCGHCVKAVGEALRAVPGVWIESVEVGRAVLTYDPEQTPPETIEAAIRDAGYPVTQTTPTAG